jgi:hypothetical protein
MLLDRAGSGGGERGSYCGSMTRSHFFVIILQSVSCAAWKPRMKYLAIAAWSEMHREKLGVRCRSQGVGEMCERK